MNIVAPESTRGCDVRRMNDVAAFLSLDDVLLDLDVPNKIRLFEGVGALLDRRHHLPHTLACDSLLAREKMGSTGLGQGVAIPHARVKGLTRPIAAFVRTRFPISFDAPDGKPVSDMVVLLVPSHANEAHLQLLAALAGMFGDGHFRERLRTSTDPCSVYQLFAHWPQYGGDEPCSAQALAKG